jgi:hypothetical protein
VTRTGEAAAALVVAAKGVWSFGLRKLSPAEAKRLRQVRLPPC